MCPCSLATPDKPAVLPYPIETLLPQSLDMILLDRVVEIGEEHIVVELKVRDDGLFSSPEHTVPAWVGLEYMAQSIAAFSGYHKKMPRRGDCVGLFTGQPSLSLFGRQFSLRRSTQGAGEKDH